jgi:hypothetical protein
MNTPLLYQNDGGSIQGLIGLFVMIFVASLFSDWAMNIARKKHRSVLLAGILGFFFGLIGVIIIAVLPSNQKPVIQEALSEPRQGERKCPFCAEIVRLEAKVCKHCGHDI